MNAETPVSGRSRPARGGWIEIYFSKKFVNDVLSRPARGGWIEIIVFIARRGHSTSRPARGGWIEIYFFKKICKMTCVPPRKGRVD